MSIERSSGVLLHVSSLPSKYGIGTFGKEAYEFVDFLKKSGQSYWQILPLNHAAEGNSPYSSYSAFALNPYFIDLDLLTEEGLLQELDYKYIDFGSDPGKINYCTILENKMKILRLSFENSKGKCLNGFEAFVEQNKDWVYDYAKFMSLRNYFNQPLQHWQEDAQRRLPQAIENYDSVIGQNEFDFWIYIQYICNQQWVNLKKYANDNEIRIFGDMPLYVSADSEDVWAHPEVFDVDSSLYPKNVAGCPPDDFALDGQRWGMPVFNWDYLEQTNFDWWMKRIKRNLSLYDVIRIDHFRGLESYYSIPVDEPSARNGTWIKAKGISFFDKIKEQFGDVDIVLEDLGFITKEVYDLKNYTGYPGMKVFQFAFLSDNNNPHLPHNCEINSVFYTSSHDNNTILGWFRNAGVDEKHFAQEYLMAYEENDVTWKCIEKVMSSESKLTIIPMQDFLELGSDARMNIPGTPNGNWEWRVNKELLSTELSKRMGETTKKYNR